MYTEETRICEICNQKYIAQRKNSICPDAECKRLRKLLMQAEAKKDRYAPIKNPQTDRIPKGKSLVEVAVEARQAGMTYGKYMEKRYAAQKCYEK